MKLSFSTLGCPDWSLADILAKGPAMGFSGVTFRAFGGELDLTRVPEFAPERRAETRTRIAAAGMQTNILATSARMLFPNLEDLEPSQRSAEAHIDLARDLGSPFIRVFGGQIAAGVSHEAAIHWSAERLRRLGDYAAPRGVKVIVETHDDCVDPAYVGRLMAATDHPAVGVLWDIGEQFRIVGRSAAECWELMGKWVLACDLKDSVADFSTKYGYRHVMLGRGDLPLRETLQLLVANGYDGWLTFEWEKRWNPTIEEPEEAFPAFVGTVRQTLASL